MILQANFLLNPRSLTTEHDLLNSLGATLTFAVKTPNNRLSRSNRKRVSDNREWDFHGFRRFLNSLTMKRKPFYCKSAINTCGLAYKNESGVAQGEMRYLLRDTHKRINELCEKNEKLLNVRTGGTYIHQLPDFRGLSECSDGSSEQDCTKSFQIRYYSAFTDVSHFTPYDRHRKGGIKCAQNQSPQQTQLIEMPVTSKHRILGQ